MTVTIPKQLYKMSTWKGLIAGASLDRLKAGSGQAILALATA
jgi:hypothetical protein